MAQKVSYAQNREDVLLARVLPAGTGFYIDAGAADPVEHSVTKYFYDLGWSGINVEPQEAFHAKLATARPRDLNLHLALSDRPGELVLHQSPAIPGWTTVDDEVARKMREQGMEVVTTAIPAETLAEVCRRHVTGPIDFLKIDVEGAERAVLLGADFTRWRPRVVVIEATEQGSPAPNHHLWEDVILAGGYLYATFDGLNRYYVRTEDEALIPQLQVPVNVFDEWLPHEFVSRIWALEGRIGPLEAELKAALSRADEIARTSGLRAAESDAQLDAQRQVIDRIRVRLAELKLDLLASGG